MLSNYDPQRSLWALLDLSDTRHLRLNTAFLLIDRSDLIQEQKTLQTWKALEIYDVKNKHIYIYIYI